MGKNFFQGKSLKDFYYNPKDREDIVQEVISKGFSDLRELELIKPDGTTTWVIHSSVSTEFEGKSALLANLADISKMRESRRKLFEKNSLAGLG